MRPDTELSSAENRSLRERLDMGWPDDAVEDTLAALREQTDNDLAHYSRIVRSSFALAWPAVFTRKRYAEFFWHCAARVSGWLPQVVLANAHAESEGSAKLLRLWRSTAPDEQAGKDILVHAQDESRHSRLFVRLTELAFPGLISAALMEQTRSSLTRVTMGETRSGGDPIPDGLLMDHLIQMNVGEIRTRLHMLLLGPALYALAPEESRDSIGRIVTGLLRDEIRHIGYTATLIESRSGAEGSGGLAHLFRSRLVEFNALTVQQTADAIRDYGEGTFPDLLEL